MEVIETLVKAGRGLSSEQRAFWDANGYLILPGHYDPSAIDALDAVTDWMWREKPRSVSVDNTVTGERTRLCAVGGVRTANRFKLNDLYLLSETVRTTVLEPRVVRVLAGLLQDDPVLINSLTIDVGTTQGPHVDTMFMTPPQDDALVATWIALEDVLPDRGPLFYYPGSHKIPAYHFSNSLQHIVDGEYEAWWAAMDAAMQERGIQRETFLAKRGDVFIWHARLIHGGSPIDDVNGTRKSLVSHFFTKWDCAYLGMPIVGTAANAFWFNRGEQDAKAIGDIIVPPEPMPLALPSKRRGYGAITRVDNLIVGDGGTLQAATGFCEVPSDHPLTVRGWAVDKEAVGPLSAIGIELPDRTVLRGLYGMGRHDVSRAHSEPRYNNSGFLLRIPAGTLSPGKHKLQIVGITADGQTTLHSMATVNLFVH